MLLFYYWIQTRWTLLLRKINLVHNPEHIPYGPYCYEYIGKNETNGGYRIKQCRYHKRGIACTYVGFYGEDAVFADQCKICGINKEE